MEDIIVVKEWQQEELIWVFEFLLNGIHNYKVTVDHNPAKKYFPEKLHEYGFDTAKKWALDQANRRLSVISEKSRIVSN